MDQSGRSIHFAQNDGSRQPLWFASDFKGQSTIKFDGSSTVLKSSTVDLQGGSTDFTFFAVIKPSVSQSYNASIFDVSRYFSYGFVFEQNQNTANEFHATWYDSTYSLQGTSSVVDTIASLPQMLEVIKSGTAYDVYVNGSRVAGGTVPPGMITPIAELAVGAHTTVDSFFNGEISELAFYNRGLSATERQQVETQLISRYGLNDADGDALPDNWELINLGTLDYGANADPGGVGRTLLQSYQAGLSPWPSPLVKSGLCVWLRADLGITKDGSNRVFDWADLSGHGAHFAQNDGSRQPVWSSSGVAGKAAVQFDGIGTIMKSVAIDLQAGGTDITVIAMIKPSSTQPAESSILDQTQYYSGGFTLGELGNTANRFFLGSTDLGGNRQGQAAFLDAPAEQVQMIEFVKAGGTQQAFINGVMQGSTTVTAGILTPTVALGLGGNASGDHFYNGQIAEVFVYNRALSAAERQQIEAQLVGRYGLNDSDGDGLPDDWEMSNLKTLSYGPNADPGGVGRTLLQSYQAGLSPWPTSPVSNGLRLWLRADLGVTKDSANHVTSWLDLSGQSVFFTQSENIRQPVWGGNSIAGKAAVQFDGSGTILKSAPTDLLGGSTDLTVIALIKPSTSQNANISILDQTQYYSGGFTISQLDNTANRYYLGSTSGGNRQGYLISADAVGGQPQLLEFVKSGGTQAAYLNGVQQSSGTVSAGIVTPAEVLGLGGNSTGDHFFNGQIAEIFVFNRALSESERQQVENQLINRYGLNDADGDGVADDWELTNLGTLNYDANADPGGVGRTLLQSYQSGLSPWPTPTLSSGLRLWLRADLGLTKDASNHISNWADLSGHAVHFSQSDGSRKPLWSANGVGGKSGAQFDGSGTILKSVAADIQAGSTDFTVIAMIKPASTQAADVSILDQTQYYSGGFTLGELGNTANRFFVGSTNSGGGRQGQAAFMDALAEQVQMIEFVKGGGNQLAFLNGVQQNSTDVSPGILTPTVALGLGGNASGDHFYNGQIAEVLVYNRALSPAERQQIETQLVSRYGLNDADGDGLPDDWEMSNFKSLSYGAGADPGGVGRTLLQSYQAGLSPWPAPALASGLRLWLRADLGVIKDGANHVNTWLDLSGRGVHFTQSDGSRQPVWSGNSMSGKAGVQFDGSGTILKSAPSDLLGGSTDLTVLAIIKPSASQSAGISILDQTQYYSGGFTIGQLDNTANRYYMGSTAAGNRQGYGISADAAAGQAQLLEFVKSGGTQAAFLNGVQQSSGAISAGIVTPAEVLGLGGNSTGDHFFNGQIAEIFVFNRALSASERQQLEAQLLSRYGLGGSSGPSYLVASGDQNIWIDPTGVARTWGRNSEGQLGDATLSSRAQMGRVSSVTDPLKNAAFGQAHGLAVSSSGQVFSWGDNYFGQLGDGSKVAHRTPIPIASLSGVTQVAAGDNHSLALMTDGSVVAWGGNQLGQLGDGTTTNRTSFVSVAGLTNIVAIAAGAKHSVALGSDGRVWVWGANEFGQQADPTVSFRATPTVVSGFGQITALISGRNHILALKQDGTVWAWGDNHAGQLGIGNMLGQSVPQAIPALSSVTMLAAGGNHSAALTSSGGLWVWGANDVGQLGNGSTVSSSVPIMLTLSGVQLLTAGRDHIVVLKADGSLQSWGANSYGQLGTTTINSFSNVPIPVSPSID